MGYSNAGKTLMLTELASVAGFASLHVTAPGDSGTGEITGGSPAYARKAVTWGAPSVGQVTATNQPVFDIPAGTSVAYGGLWSASSGGTFYGSGDVEVEVFGSQGTYTLVQLVADLLA